jgi:DNA-binding CsgD family transcriptional regulator
MPEPSISKLTPQQRKCLELVAQLKSSKQIALELGISPKTVDSYLTTATQLLGATDRRHAAQIYAQSAQEKSPWESSRLDGSITDPSPFASIADLETSGLSGLRDIPVDPKRFFASEPPRAKGWTPDDIIPQQRLVLILVAAVALLVGGAAAVNLIDAFSRFAK